MEEETITREEFEMAIRMERLLSDIKITAARIEAKLDVMNANLAAITTPPRRTGW